MKRNLIFNPPPLRTVLCLPGLPRAGSLIYDRSLYGNHGTITGATWTRLPSGLPVLNFDGLDDYVDCGSAASLQLKDSNFTLESWLNPTEAGDVAVAGDQIIGTSNNYYRLLFDENRMVNFVTFDIATRSLVSSALTLGTPYHVRGTWDGTTKRLYINNVLENSAVVSKPTGDAAIQIGGGGAARWLKGQIGLGRIYNAVASNNAYQQERHLFGV